MEKAAFIERYKKLGWDFKENNLPKHIRINHNNIDTKKLISMLEKRGIKLKKLSFLKHGYQVLKEKVSVGATVEYLLGYYSLQEPASQMCSELLNPANGDTILDMCAAPGSKTIHMSQLMNNKGVIVALDKNKKRLISLKNNLERTNTKNVIVYNKNALDISSFPKFDKILLDAPCSGNFTQQKNWFEKRDLLGIQQNAMMQRKLFQIGFDLLKKDGIILYSTCSLEPEENEENVEWFLENFNVKLEYQRRFWPGETQGFFIAKFKKIE